MLDSFRHRIAKKILQMYFGMCTSSEERTCSWVPQGLEALWNRTVCTSSASFAVFAQIHEAGGACINLDDKYREMLNSVEFQFRKGTLQKVPLCMYGEVYRAKHY